MKRDKDFFNNLVKFNDLNEMEGLIREFSLSEKWINIPKGKDIKFYHLTWLLFPGEKLVVADLYYKLVDDKTGKESKFKVFQVNYIMDKSGHLMM